MLNLMSQPIQSGERLIQWRGYSGGKIAAHTVGRNQLLHGSQSCGVSIHYIVACAAMNVYIHKTWRQNRIPKIYRLRARWDATRRPRADFHNGIAIQQHHGLFHAIERRVQPACGKDNHGSDNLNGFLFSWRGTTHPKHNQTRLVFPPSC
jgi:hypothetical protein